MQTKPDWLDTSTILLGVVGSTAHGLQLEDSDHDELGVCIEPIEEALTLGEGFQQHVYRTAEERTGISDAPSQPGDIDRTIYGLRKFCRMAVNGNPSVLVMFFLEGAAKNSLGTQLQELAPLFISKDAGGKYLGYMESQRQRLLGERGGKRVKRPELTEKFGYDVSYAAHVLQLGYQGVELMDTGRLELPFKGEKRDYLLKVKTGGSSLEEVLKEAVRLEGEIKAFRTLSSLPEHPDHKGVEAWMQQRYLDWWKASQTHWRAEAPNKFVAYKPPMESCSAVLNSALGGSKE